MTSQFNERELREYVDEKNAFKALMKEHRYKAPLMRDKDKEYKDTYLCSFIHKSNFKAGALDRFKLHVENLNMNKKEETQRDEKKRAAEI